MTYTLPCNSMRQWFSYIMTLNLGRLFVQTLCLRTGIPIFLPASWKSSNYFPGYVYAVASFDTVYTEGPCHTQTNVWNQSISRSCPRRIQTASRKLDH